MKSDSKNELEMKVRESCLTIMTSKDSQHRVRWTFSLILGIHRYWVVICCCKRMRWEYPILFAPVASSPPPASPTAFFSPQIYPVSPNTQLLIWKIIICRGGVGWRSSYKNSNPSLLKTEDITDLLKTIQIKIIRLITTFSSLKTLIIYKNSRQISIK